DSRGCWNGRWERRRYTCEIAAASNTLATFREIKGVALWRYSIADISFVGFSDYLMHCTVTEFYPPAPIPQPRPLGPIALLKTLRVNALECWTKAHFEAPNRIGRISICLGRGSERTLGRAPDSGR